MKLFGRAPLPADHRDAVDAALDDAFAPLRARTANIGPARVRAAVRWSAPEPRSLGGLALLGRISELSLVAAISAFVFAGSVASLVAAPTLPDVSRDAVLSATRVLNGRIAFQPPIDPHAIEFRVTVGEFAANAATARHPASAPVDTIRARGPLVSGQ
jgi:hypothetical protein